MRAWIFVCVAIGCSLSALAKPPAADDFRAGTDVTEVADVERGVLIRKSGGGDAFVRFGRFPFDQAHNALAVTFNKFVDRGQVTGRIEFLDDRGAYLGGESWLPRTGTADRYVLDDIAAFARRNRVENAATWQLFLRVSAAPTGGFTISDITVAPELSLDRASPLVPSYADPLTGLAVVARTAEPIPVVYEDEPADVELALTSFLTEVIDVEVTLSITRDDGEPGLQTEATLNVPADGVVTVPLPADDLQRGVYFVDYTITTDERKRTGQTRFAVVPRTERPPLHEGRHYHVATGIGIFSGDEYEQGIAILDAAGIRGARFHHKWEAAEPRQGEWEFAPMDRAVERLAARGIAIQHILAYNTPWAVTDEQLARDPNWMMHAADPALFAEYARRMVERYGHHIKYWEVWNEPDITNFWLGDTQQYIDLLRTTHATIKAVDPDAQVLTAGFATLTPHGSRKYPHLQRDVLRAANDAFDVHAFHQHGRTPVFAEIVRGPLREVRSAMADPKPLWFNETAMTTGGVPGVAGELYQAESAVKKLALAFAEGAIGYTWYNHREDGRTWGLVTRDFEPKPMLLAYGTWIRTVGDRPLTEQLDARAGNFVHLWGDGGDQVVTAWSMSDAASGRVLALDVGADARLTLVDLMGRETPLATHDGLLLLPIDTTPVYVRIENASAAPTLLPPLVQIDGPVVAFGSGTVDVMAKLTNPLDTPAEITLGTSEPIVVQLAPEEARRVVVPLAVDADTDRRFGDAIELDVDIALDARPVGTLRLPVVAGALIPADQPADRAPDFSLDDRNTGEIVNLFDYAPAFTHLVWNGPADLAADVWLTRIDPTTIRVTVNVRDDIHAQPFAGGRVWEGDSVQLAFAANEAGQLITLGIARTDASDVVTHLCNHPADPPTATVTDIPNGLRYEVDVPLDLFAVDDLDAGVRFNLIVNDNDGEAREGWAQVAPGLAEDRDVARFPIVRFAD